MKTSSAEKALGYWWQVIDLCTYMYVAACLVYVKRIKSYDCKFPSFHTTKTQNKEQEKNNTYCRQFPKFFFFQVCEIKEYNFYSKKVADTLLNHFCTLVMIT